MKNLRNTDAVFHAWAHQEFEAAKCGNVSFVGTRLYSYAACIANLLPNGAVAHTTRSWSVTTSSHQCSARQATNHMASVWCYNPEWSVGANRTYVEDSIKNIIRNTPEPVLRKDGVETVNSKNKRDKLWAGCLHLVQQFNGYLAASGDQVTPPLEITDDMKAAAEQLRQQDQVKERQREAAAKAAAFQAQEHVRAWKRHEPVSNLVNLGAAPPALRLSKDKMHIETSWGAQIPVVQAERMWKSIRIAMKMNMLIEPDDDLPRSETYVGPYRINEFRPDGSIKVGCHTIAYSELEGMAVTLGLKEKAK